MSSLTHLIRADIAARFGNGQIFSTLDFHQTTKNAGQSSRNCTHVLSTMLHNGQIKVVGKFKHKAGSPPYSKYQVVAASKEVSVIEAQPTDYPSGSLTVWHPMATPPHHIGRYDIKQVGSEIIERRLWNNGWVSFVGCLPDAFVYVWRGVTR